MARSIVIEGPEDFESDMDFGKFMEEIVVTEETKKRVVEEDLNEGVRGIIQRYAKRPSTCIRFGRK